MSKDRIEDFIRQNRNALDTEIPSVNIWAEIEQGLEATPPRKKGNTYKIFAKIAALVLLVLGIGIWIFNPLKQEENKITYINVSPKQEILDENPELAQLSSFYTQKINANKKRLATLNHHDTELFNDLKQMENMFDSLEIEWSKNSHQSNSQLVNAMIDNYRMRSSLLENVVQRVEYKKHFIKK